MPDVDPPRCAKCGRTMELGVIIDRVHYYAAAMPLTWMEGAPEKSFLTGLKMSGRQRHSVLTFRCGGCGYVESYAPPSSARSS